MSEHMSQVAAEIAAGQGMLLRSAAKLFPSSRRGAPVSLSCVLRWIIRGTPGPNGERVKLEGARLAGKWVTSASALARFIAAHTPHAYGTTGTPAPRTGARLHRASTR